MKKALPITKAQRARIQYRARMVEQCRMIRAMRDVLGARGYSHHTISDFVTDVLGLLKRSHE